MNTIEQAQDMTKRLRKAGNFGFTNEAADTIDALIAENTLLSNTLESRDRNIETLAEENRRLIEELDCIKRQEPVAIVHPAKLHQGCGQTEWLVDVQLPARLYLEAGAQTAPDGYQLVPIEPTDVELAVGVEAMRLFVTTHSLADFKLGYKAMLAAAKEQGNG